MEDHPRGGSDQRDPVLVDEALELRFCVCLVCEITGCQRLIKIMLIVCHSCMLVLYLQMSLNIVILQRY